MKEYKTLLNELELYNPELLDKKRLLAISKTDLVDEKKIKKIDKKIPKDLPHVYISSLTNKGISELKDLIWQSL
jgi:GTP-binding protein